MTPLETRLECEKLSAELMVVVKCLREAIEDDPQLSWLEYHPDILTGIADRMHRLGRQQAVDQVPLTEGILLNHH